MESPRNHICHQINTQEGLLSSPAQHPSAAVLTRRPISFKENLLEGEKRTCSPYQTVREEGRLPLQCQHSSRAENRGKGGK